MGTTRHNGVLIPFTGGTNIVPYDSPAKQP